MDIVLRLREFRRLAGLTQEQAAAKSGVGVKSISSWETGRRTDRIKVKQLAALAQAYGITPQEFFAPKLEEKFVEVPR